MSNLKFLKNKIRSTKGMLKITGAMKLVSAAKFNRFNEKRKKQQQIIESLEQVLDKIYCRENISICEKEHYLFLVGTNKGLCAGYNTLLKQKLKAFMEKQSINFNCYCLGTKTAEFFCDEDIVKLQQVVTGDDYSFLTALEQLISPKNWKDKSFSLHVAYTHFFSQTKMVPQVIKIYPLNVNNSSKNNYQEIKNKELFEPSAFDILEYLLPQYLKHKLINCFHHAKTSEYASRMQAMDQAVKNCQESIKRKTLMLNKERQQLITREIVEIVSGSESVIQG